jgi:proteic killer suppression protein
MEVDFDDPSLEDLERDPRSTAGHGDAVDRGFRKVMQIVRAAPDERDLYALKGLHFEKLEGSRHHQRSLKINKQWRLVVELRKGEKSTRVGVISIEDYH